MDENSSTLSYKEEKLLKYLTEPRVTVAYEYTAMPLVECGEYNENRSRRRRESASPTNTNPYYYSEAGRSTCRRRNPQQVVFHLAENETDPRISDYTLTEENVTVERVNKKGVDFSGNEAYLSMDEDRPGPKCRVDIRGERYSARFQIGLDPAIDQAIYTSMKNLRDACERGAPNYCKSRSALGEIKHCVKDVLRGKCLEGKKDLVKRKSSRLLGMFNKREKKIKDVSVERTETVQEPGRKQVKRITRYTHIYENPKEHTEESVEEKLDESIRNYGVHKIRTAPNKNIYSFRFDSESNLDTDSEEFEMDNYHEIRDIEAFKRAARDKVIYKKINIPNKKSYSSKFVDSSNVALLNAHTSKKISRDKGINGDTFLPKIPSKFSLRDIESSSEELSPSFNSCCVVKNLAHSISPENSRTKQTKVAGLHIDHEYPERDCRNSETVRANDQETSGFNKLESAASFGCRGPSFKDTTTSWSSLFEVEQRDPTAVGYNRLNNTIPLSRSRVTSDDHQTNRRTIGGMVIRQRKSNYEPCAHDSTRQSKYKKRKRDVDSDNDWNSCSFINSGNNPKMNCKNGIKHKIKNKKSFLKNGRIIEAGQARHNVSCRVPYPTYRKERNRNTNETHPNSIGIHRSIYRKNVSSPGLAKHFTTQIVSNEPRILPKICGESDLRSSPLNSKHKIKSPNTINEFGVNFIEEHSSTVCDKKPTINLINKLPYNINLGQKHSTCNCNKCIGKTCSAEGLSKSGFRTDPSGFKHLFVSSELGSKDKTINSINKKTDESGNILLSSHQLGHSSDDSERNGYHPIYEPSVTYKKRLDTRSADGGGRGRVLSDDRLVSVSSNHRLEMTASTLGRSALDIAENTRSTKVNVGINNLSNDTAQVGHQMYCTPEPGGTVTQVSDHPSSSHDSDVTDRVTRSQQLLRPFIEESSKPLANKSNRQTTDLQICSTFDELKTRPQQQNSFSTYLCQQYSGFTESCPDGKHEQSLPYSILKSKEQQFYSVKKESCQKYLTTPLHRQYSIITNLKSEHQSIEELATIGLKRHGKCLPLIHTKSNISDEKSNSKNDFTKIYCNLNNEMDNKINNCVQHNVTWPPQRERKTLSITENIDKKFYSNIYNRNYLYKFILNKTENKKIKTCANANNGKVNCHLGFVFRKHRSFECVFDKDNREAEIKNSRDVDFDESSANSKSIFEKPFIYNKMPPVINEFYSNGKKPLYFGNRQNNAQTCERDRTEARRYSTNLRNSLKGENTVIGYGRYRWTCNSIVPGGKHERSNRDDKSEKYFSQSSLLKYLIYDNNFHDTRYTDSPMVYSMTVAEKDMDGMERGNSSKRGDVKRSRKESILANSFERRGQNSGCTCGKNKGMPNHLNRLSAQQAQFAIATVGGIENPNVVYKCRCKQKDEVTTASVKRSRHSHSVSGPKSIQKSHSTEVEEETQKGTSSGPGTIPESLTRRRLSGQGKCKCGCKFKDGAPTHHHTTKRRSTITRTTPDNQIIESSTSYVKTIKPNDLSKRIIIDRPNHSSNIHSSSGRRKVSVSQQMPSVHSSGESYGSTFVDRSTATDFPSENRIYEKIERQVITQAKNPIREYGSDTSLSAWNRNRQVSTTAQTDIMAFSDERNIFGNGIHISMTCGPEDCKPTLLIHQMDENSGKVIFNSPKSIGPQSNVIFSPLPIPATTSSSSTSKTVKFSGIVSLEEQLVNQEMPTVVVSTTEIVEENITEEPNVFPEKDNKSDYFSEEVIKEVEIISPDTSEKNMILPRPSDATRRISVKKRLNRRSRRPIEEIGKVHDSPSEESDGNISSNINHVIPVTESTYNKQPDILEEHSTDEILGNLEDVIVTKRRTITHREASADKKPEITPVRTETVKMETVKGVVPSKETSARKGPEVIIKEDIDEEQDDDGNVIRTTRRTVTRRKPNLLDMKSEKDETSRATAARAPLSHTEARASKDQNLIIKEDIDEELDDDGNIIRTQRKTVTRRKPNGVDKKPEITETVNRKRTTEMNVTESRTNTPSPSRTLIIDEEINEKQDESGKTVGSRKTVTRRELLKDTKSEIFPEKTETIQKRTTTITNVEPRTTLPSEAMIIEEEINEKLNESGSIVKTRTMARRNLGADRKSEIFPERTEGIRSRPTILTNAKPRTETFIRTVLPTVHKERSMMINDKLDEEMDDSSTVIHEMRKSVTRNVDRNRGNIETIDTETRTSRYPEKSTETLLQRVSRVLTEPRESSTITVPPLANLTTVEYQERKVLKNKYTQTVKVKCEVLSIHDILRSDSLYGSLKDESYPAGVGRMTQGTQTDPVNCIPITEEEQQKRFKISSIYPFKKKKAPTATKEVVKKRRIEQSPSTQHKVYNASTVGKDCGCSCECSTLRRIFSKSRPPKNTYMMGMEEFTLFPEYKDKTQATFMMDPKKNSFIGKKQNNSSINRKKNYGLINSTLALNKVSEDNIHSLEDQYKREENLTFINSYQKNNSYARSKVITKIQREKSSLSINTPDSNINILSSNSSELADSSFGNVFYNNTQTKKRKKKYSRTAHVEFKNSSSSEISDDSLGNRSE